MSDRGMTLVELMVSAAILLGGGGALIVGMHYAMAHSDYLNDFQISMNAVQGRLEELAATDLSTLWTDPSFATARTAAGQCMGLDEDRNCSGSLAGQDLNGNGQLDEPLPGARLNVRVREFPPGAVNPSVVDLYVSACWNDHGRVIGEDASCNGQLDAGEDANGNGWLDSPAMASTRVAARD